MTVIAVDLGGTKLAVARVEHGVVLDRREVPTSADRTPAAVIEQIVEQIGALPPGVPATRLAVAATGRVHGGRVTALNQSTMPGWVDVNLQETLERLTGLSTVVINDADAAALAESKRGAGQHADAMLFVTVSTGIGAGAVLNGQLLQSASGIHADFGFLRTADGLSTIEDVAGGRPLERWMHQHRGNGGAAQLVSLADHEPQAAARLHLAVDALVRGFGDVRVMLGTEDVVIGGSVGLNPVFFAALSGKCAVQPDLYRVRPQRALLGADAGLHGAALFAETADPPGGTR